MMALLQTWYRPYKKTNKVTYGSFPRMQFPSSTHKERLLKIMDWTLYTRNSVFQKQLQWSTHEIKLYSVQIKASLKFLPKKCRKVPMFPLSSSPGWKCKVNLLSSPLTIWKNYALNLPSGMLLSSLQHLIMSILKKSATHIDWKDWKKNGMTGTKIALPATSTCRMAIINCKSNLPTVMAYGWTISALYLSTYCLLSGKRAGHGFFTLFSLFSLQVLSYMYSFTFIVYAIK